MHGCEKRRASWVKHEWWLHCVWPARPHAKAKEGSTRRPEGAALAAQFSIFQYFSTKNMSLHICKHILYFCCGRIWQEQSASFMRSPWTDKWLSWCFKYAILAALPYMKHWKLHIQAAYYRSTTLEDPGTTLWKAAAPQTKRPHCQAKAPGTNAERHMIV